MTWVLFESKEAFVAYHDQACTDRGIPKPGQIQATGEDALGNQWTTAWVRPVDDGGVLKAFVPDGDVQTYKLTVSTAPPTTTDTKGLSVSTATKTNFDAEIAKPLPDTWNGKPVPTTTVEGLK